VSKTIGISPNEIWSVMLVAFRMLTNDQWAVRFERLPDTPE
jgi:hypothetical protein